MRITVCLHAATDEGVAHDREIAADTVEDAISLTRWYENGQKAEEVTLKDGEEISFKKWDEDGKLK